MNKKGFWAGGFIIFIVIVGLISNSYTEADLENDAVPLVTQILQEQNDINLDCEEVVVTQEYENNTYDAKATLSNSEVINISIEHYPDKDNRIYVEIPNEEILSLYW